MVVRKDKRIFQFVGRVLFLRRKVDLFREKTPLFADETPFTRGREAALEKLTRGGFIEIVDGFMRLTLRGMEVQDAVVLELMEADS